MLMNKKGNQKIEKCILSFTIKLPRASALLFFPFWNGTE